MQTSREWGGLVDEAQSLVRELLVPLDDVARLVPDGGEALELGCGQGLLMKRIAPRVARIIGVDYDPRKCRLAERALARFAGASVAQDDIRSYVQKSAPGRFRSIILVDTLSHMSDADQDRLLADCVRALAPGGVLILKFLDERPRWKATVARTLSSLVYGLRFSVSDGQQFHYRSSDDYERVLAAHGLRVRRHALHRRSALPHVVVRAEKP